MMYFWIIAAICAAALIALLVAVYMGLLEDLHITPKPKKGRKRVACVGDSVTYGCLVPGQPWNSYPRALGRLLGKGYCVGNFGYSDRTAQKSGDRPYTAEKLYRRSLDLQPDIVLLMLGSNDTKAHNWNAESCYNDLCGLVDSYRSLDSRPEVYLLVPPPMYTFFGKVPWELRSDVLENELVPMYREIAEKKNVPLIDIHGAFENMRELFTDGVHPNAAGARLLAGTVYDQLKNKTRRL